MATKERRKAPPGAPKYHRLTNEKRIIIKALRKEGCSKKHIAERVGFHPTTVWRELKRNVSKKGYRHKKAQGKANHRVAVKAAKRRRFTSEMWALAKDRLAKGWTFEQIHGRCRRDGIAMVCAETLYKEYYGRQKLVMAGKSHEVLSPLPKRQRKRRTRFTLVAYVASKESPCVMSAIIGMLASIPKDMLKTCTFDNGKEFALFKQLEQALGVKVYFAKPYHSWERGTNENRNGVVRKALPKGRSFDDITEEEMRRIDYMLNDRPLRCLNWRTPREAFAGLILRHMSDAV